MTFSTGSFPQSVAVGDFNNDTQLDIVVANSNDNSVSALLGYGNGSFQNQMTFSTGSRPQSVAVGDFNNDTQLDIVVANSYSSNVSILLQYNRGFLRDEKTYATGGGSDLRYTVVGDMNNDGQLDIAIANYGTNDVGILFGLGNGAFLNQMIFDTGVQSHPSCIALGYFNRDTELDFAVAYDGTMTVDIFLGSGNGTFVRQISDGIHFVSTPLFIASGDINGDGISEIIVAYENSDNVDLLVTYNNVSFENKMAFSTGISPQSVAAGDFNNDTRLDIVVANFFSHDVSVLLGYGNGSFQNQMTFSTGSYPQSVAVGDFNNDIRLDIVVASYGDDDVSVLLGYGNGSFQNQMTFSTGSWPQSVAVGDFNNDTQPDIVVA
ncbi:unnamed protein product, partial [Rotaria magnacalcarata]